MGNQPWDTGEPWHFSFENLAQLAEAVLTAKANLIARVMELCKKKVYAV